MYIIFGANGQVGRASITALRRAGQPVRAVLREQHDARQREFFEQSGCDVAFADLRDARAIGEALRDATAVQMLCPLPNDDPHPARTMRETIAAAVDALSAHRPPLVLALSDYGAELEHGTGITMLFHELEARLKPLAGPDTHLILLRASEHMHNWARVVPAAIATNRLPSLHHPLTKRFPTVAAQDVGTLAAELMTTPRDARSLRTVSIEGPRRLDARDVAHALSTALGRPIDALELPRDTWTPTLKHAGLSDEHAQLIVDLYDAHNAGRIDVERDATERYFGATDLADVFATLVPHVVQSLAR
ncbi:NAD(P)H-binding protein [Paraburkholderia flava]|uniref:NmrA family NAD(P)-binding protein n=1 Tax=Paraburkholderia flava TaxID=2547393 RepID=UPI00105B7D1F|nr:NAD(P)H-binding protein [Paraburkholderia flava]